MNIPALLCLLASGAVSGFLADMLRRCFVVEAWTLVPFVALALLGALWLTRWSWRAAYRSWLAARRQRLPADFVRPNTASFPEQPKRGVR